MTISVAFFLSLEGHLVHVQGNHVGTIIRDPGTFGLTREEIESTYQRYGEKIGVEGEARKQILLKVIEKGWIRLRRYPNRHWSVTAERFTPSVQEVLRELAIKMLSGVGGIREADRYMPVKISTAEGESLCTIKDLADGSRHRGVGLTISFYGRTDHDRDPEIPVS